MPPREDLIAWMPMHPEVHRLGAVWMIPGLELNREQHLHLLSSRLLLDLCQREDDPEEALQTLVSTLEQKGLDSGAGLPEPMYRASALVTDNWALIDRLELAGAFLEYPQGPVTQDDPEAREILEETGLEEWASYL